MEPYFSAGMGNYIDFSRDVLKISTDRYNQIEKDPKNLRNDTDGSDERKSSDESLFLPGLGKIKTKIFKP